MPPLIYLDNNATTPLARPVIDAMHESMELFGNPSSSHSLGHQAKDIVAHARGSVAALIGAAKTSEVVFTSGGTESDNWAILGALESQVRKDHVVTTAVEHEAVRKLCEKLERDGKRVTWVGVDQNGLLDIDQLLASIEEKTAVVSVMMANNETGVTFPVEEIAATVKTKSDALVHVDAVNAAGKTPIDMSKSKIDLLSISAHKFHGPKGIGALYIRDRVELPAFLIGGAQESGRRAGTEAVHQIAGIGAAAEYARDLSRMQKVRELRDRLENSITASIPCASINGDSEQRLPNTSNISFEHLNGEMILHYLDEAGICVSTGSACNSESRTSSPVLAAMDIPYSKAMGSIRFSLCRMNEPDEIGRTLEVLPGVIEKLRRIAGR